MSRLLHSLYLDTVGGVESVFADYLAHPGSALHEHHLMILNRRCHPFFKKAVSERVAGTFHAKYWGPLRVPKSLRAARSGRYAAAVKPDMLMVYNTPDSPSAWAAAPHSRTCIYYERGAAWWAPADNAQIASHFRQTHRFFCNSTAAKRLLNLRYGVSPGLCDVIYNPMRLAEEAPGDPKPPRERFRIGMAGRLIPVKGMVTGLHALAHLLKHEASFELVIAGGGPELETLKAVAGRLGISHAVTFLGVVQDMRAFYRSLDVFVCPSLREPLGNVAIEANGSGCPVICTAVDGLPEAIVPGLTGLCLRPTLSQAGYLALGVSSGSLPQQVYDPVSDALVPPKAIDPAQLAEAIWNLARSPEQRAAMSQAAILSVKERFSLDGYITRLHGLLEKAAAG